MKKITIIVLLLFSLVYTTWSKPVFTKSKYLISTLYDKNAGVLGLGNDTYNIAFYPNISTNQINDSSYWEIRNINGNEYTFRNAATGKYIRYDQTLAERAALRLTNNLQADKSTSFFLEQKRTGNIDYYLITPVTNTSKAWDRRTQLQGNIFPVGVYNSSGSNIQCFVFYDAEGVTVADDGKIPVALPSATQDLGNYGTYLDSLSFGNKIPAIDNLTNNVYLSVNEGFLNTFQTVRVKYAAKNPNHKLYINKYAVTDNSDIRLNYSTTGIIIEIRYGNQVLVSGKLISTGLPVVQLYTDEDITNVYNLGRAVVTEPHINTPAEIMLSNIRLRGDYASRVEKKSFNLKLKEDDGESPAYRSFMGLRSDNAWILDAMYIDPARMRNRVSTDLWLDFSKPVYYAQNEPDMFNGTRGFFVEVFLNNTYNGLYCMTEKIDRKQLNLKKLKYSADSTTVTQRGALYKASSWSIGTQLGNPNTWGTSTLPAYDNKSESWTAFEVKYPDLGDGEPAEWKPAYDAVKVPYWETPDNEFRANLNTYFDMPVFIDYYLFLDLMLASDNHGKNYYLSVYDQTISPMVSLTPWDLDGVWGRRWDGTTARTYANQSFEKYIINNEPKQNNLYLRLMAGNIDGFNDKLKKRYYELRGSHFNLESLMNRFNVYLQHFKTSGVDLREIERWGIGDFETEMTFLSDWITTRLDYLDKQYLGKAYTATDNLHDELFTISPNPARTDIKVTGTMPGSIIEILNIQGKTLLTTTASGPEIYINIRELEPGIYILRNQNKTSRFIKAE